jgi:ferredoxin
MVKAKRKSLEEIYTSVQPYRKILVVGCGGCVSVCLAGGQKESEILCSELETAAKIHSAALKVETYTVERQCNSIFLAELNGKANEADALLSMACGAGVQFLAEHFPGKPVFPAVNTVFIGIDRAVGVYEERCRSCGNCVLAYTGGICPVTRCAKSIFNGPCGGASAGKCEVNPDIPCAWHEIYDRLKQQNRLENITDIWPAPDWHNQVQGVLVQPGFEAVYLKKT